MKLILGLVLIGVCVLLGVKFSEKYTKSKRFYSDLHDFNRVLINKISYSNESVIKILNQLDDNGECIEYIKERFKGEKNTIALYYLSENEKTFFNGYIDEIGKSERDKQVNYLNKMDIEFELKLKKAIENEKKYKPLYVKLGILLGLVMFIIIL